MPEAKLFGPLQVYPEAAIMVEAVKLKVVPEQIGALLPAVGAPGGGFTITVVVEAVLVHPFSELVTE